MSDIDEHFTFQTSSPQSLRQSTSPHQLKNVHDYNFSGIIYDETTDAAPSTDEEEHLPLRSDHDLLQPASTRVSSVSSFPASVVHHTLPDEEPRTPSKTFLDYDQDCTTTPTYQSPRAHSTGFRHPSSVRALQMRDEFDLSSEFEALTSSRRRDSRLSFFSQRSSGSAPNSPVRRVNRSNHSSPQKSNKTKLRKEFPLVLLHCTLLPPALALRAPQLNDGILEAIIPQPYNRRWKALQEKVVRNTEVKARGVLIPHPRDEYELLEEKLLESLELERPRLQDGHFTITEDGNGATDSGFESASSSDQFEDGVKTMQSDACPDCGKNISNDIEVQRKWDIKVYAANGLLKSSAWSAAWQEMEKVDVEVGVWMPEDVRREVDSRIEVLLEQDKADRRNRRRDRRQADDERLREIYGSDIAKPENAPPNRTQDEIDGLSGNVPKDTSDGVLGEHQEGEQSNAMNSQTPQTERTNQTRTHSEQVDIPLLNALTNYIRLLAQDRRNIAIFLLTALVLFYGMNRPDPSPVVEAIDGDTSLHQDVQITTSQVVVTSTSTVLATDTSTVIETIKAALPTMEALYLESSHFKPDGVSSVILDSLSTQTHSMFSETPEPDVDTLDHGSANVSYDDATALIDTTYETLSSDHSETRLEISDVPLGKHGTEIRGQDTCASPYNVLVTEQGICQATSLA